ncbi:MAG: Na+/H+ antiporter subunit E [Gammaproteobacteria bacterium]
MSGSGTSAIRSTRGHMVLVFLLGWLAWLLLAGTLAVEEIVAGALVSLLVTLLSGQHLAVYAGVRFTPGAILHLFAFLAVFLRALLYANIDMARRVLSPALPIRPAVVEVETQLQSALGKLLLTNAITLTPGTLSIDVEGNRIKVHWVDCPPGLDLHGKTAAIVSGFERHLLGFLV